MPRLLSPTSLAEALEMLGNEPAAQPLAGGVAILQRVRLEGSLAQTYVHLGGIDEMRGIRQEDGMLVIGAMTSLADLASSPAVAGGAPLLRAAATQAASPGVRAQGSLGGNLVAAGPASDPAAALLALDATITLTSRDGPTSLPLSRALSTGRAWLPAGSVLAWVALPIPRTGPAWGFERLPLRGAADSSAATIAVQLAIADRRIAGAAAWATAVANHPLQLASFEASLEGQHIDDVARAEASDALRHAAEADSAGARLLDDTRASAWYRGAVILELAVRAAAAGARSVAR